MPESDASYTRKLSDVLREKDVDALREFLIVSAENRDPDYVAEVEAIPEEELRKRMYKMILARPDLSDMHAEARTWLQEHGKDVGF
jgi:hypothetical protein